MTITAQIAYIKSHPFYAVALRDEAAMEKLLFEVMLSTYLTCSANCARAYRQSRRMNGPQIVEAIRDCEPPSNLDVRLPIPAVVSPGESGECVVISIKNSASISVADEVKEG